MGAGTRSAGRLEFTADGDTRSFNDPVRVMGILWNGANNGDDLNIEDEDGNTVFEWKAETGKRSMYFDLGGKDSAIRVSTLTAETLDGGRVIIYLNS